MIMSHLVSQNKKITPESYTVTSYTINCLGERRKRKNSARAEKSFCNNSNDRLATSRAFVEL